MDELRARAYMDLLLGTDSRPGQDGPGPGGSGLDRPASPGTPSGTGALPVGFGGRVNLTIPLATLLDLAERPGEIPGLGPVDPTWPATSPMPPPQPENHVVRHRNRPGRPRHRPRLRQTRTQGSHQVPGETRETQVAGRTNQGRQGSPSPPPTGRGHPTTDTAPGSCTPGHLDSGTSSSPWTPFRPATATTGTRPTGMTPGSSSGTCPRSGTPPAPGQVAEELPHSVISNITSRMKQGADRICVTAGLSAGATIGSSSSLAGRSSSSPTAPSGGPPHRGASTPPKPPATPFSH